MKAPSKALEANLRTSRVRVVHDPKYLVLKDIVAPFHGIQEKLDLFLTEACHPYKNWRLVLDQARSFVLNNFHLLRDHAQGPEGVRLFLEVFLVCMEQAGEKPLRTDAADYLMAFSHKIIDDSQEKLISFINPLNKAFQTLADLDQKAFGSVRRSFYQVNGLVSALEPQAGEELDFAPLTKLLFRYLEETYACWLGQPDPRSWFLEQTGAERPPEQVADLFQTVTHTRLKTLLETLAGIRAAPGPDRQKALQAAALPGFRQISAEYERLPQALGRAGGDSGQGDQWKLLFLFHIMSLAGLAPIQERSLDQINRTLARIIDSQRSENVHSLIADTFRILNKSFSRYPLSALHTSLNMGRAVYRTQDEDLLELFNAGVIGLGFQSPAFQGMGEDWDIRINGFHVENIRTYLRLMELDPKRSRKLISALIINLSLGGVVIKDTELFPRDITRLLNSEIAPVYNLIKQLCRLFPTYFNEIGAEGRLRDISTQIDDLLHRRDALIHFLRKQSHVQSSPLTVGLMEAVLDFWLTRDPAALENLLPGRILEGLEPRGGYVDGVHGLMSDLRSQGLIAKGSDLLNLDREDLKAWLERQKEAPAVDRKRLALAHELYLLLHHKYHSDPKGLWEHLDRLRPVFPLDLEPLRKGLKDHDLAARIEVILDYLEKLKRIILSPEAFPIREDIYHKRHVAVDIPSMYGSYHEPKFDALGLTLRLESLANVCFQELIDGLDLNLITRATLFRILDILRLFDRVLRLDGISSQEMARQIDLLAHALTIRGFSFSQYLDIFRGFSRVVGNIVGDSFNSIHHNQLVNLISRTGGDWIRPKYLAPQAREPSGGRIHRISEVFLRDLIAASLGLQQLDQLISRVMATFFQQEQKLSPGMLPLLLNYDPSLTTTRIEPAKEDLLDVIHLGAKGFNLVRIKGQGLPVPPGFIVTTEVFKCRGVLLSYGPAWRNFRERVLARLRSLEKQTGKRFGDPKNPLLLSTRSGSSISQPGMLSTFLNVGLNPEIVAGMAGSAKDRTWFSWDCYRRYLQCFAMARGLARDEFDAIMTAMKDKFGLSLKQQFSGDQMRRCALAYRGYIESQGVEIIDDPVLQLESAIKDVIASWDSDKAETYRRIMGISDDWGTAVTVQAMVFGNLSRQSGSGVFFTHNPRWSGDRFQLWGDFTLGNQGEDVVSGLVRTRPLNHRQAEIEKRSDGPTLESSFPHIYGRLEKLARGLVEQGGYSPQEMEFTFEGPRESDLYFLQTRDMDLRNHSREDLPSGFVLPPGSLLGHGIGVSGGAMTGRVVFDLEEIRAWKRQEPGRPLILVRNDTVPDDINEIFEADGLLTARGGSTSHAAIVAYRLDKTCVVGFGEMTCDEKARTCRLDQGEILVSGDLITLNGREGSVYRHPRAMDREKELGT